MKTSIIIVCIIVFAIIANGTLQSKCHDTETMEIIRHTEFSETDTFLYFNDLDVLLRSPALPVVTNETRNTRIFITGEELIIFMSGLPKTDTYCD